MITVDNPDTVKQVKALVELMNTQGKLVNVQREGAFKGVKRGKAVYISVSSSSA